MSHRPRLHARPGRHRGLSIVELMIGIAIGLFIVAGATLVLTTQLGDNRRLLLEAQIQQDMRATADMISRDIRRAGYWGQSYRQIWPAAGALANPYTRIEPSETPLATDNIEYDRSTDEENRGFGVDDNGVDAEAGRPRERVGFRLNDSNKTIDYQLGANNWQALTDKEVIEVTTFRLDMAARDVPVPCGAGPQCPVLGPGGCPLVQTYRDVTINIVARARHDAAVQRALRDNVRLRNSVPREVCPP
jgi:prepilin peptidase dependent protein B